MMIVIIGVVIAVICMVLYLCTACTDPGIVFKHRARPLVAVGGGSGNGGGGGVGRSNVVAEGGGLQRQAAAGNVDTAVRCG